MEPVRHDVFPTLRADGKALDNSPGRMAWLRPSSPGEPFNELTARFRQDGSCSRGPTRCWASRQTRRASAGR